MPELSLAEQTVVWGHSQGGGAALWTGILAPSYAPDANVIGVAALSPASDLPGLVSNLDVVPGGAIFASYVIQGYSDTYSDVRFNDYVRPQAQILAREVASRCLVEPSIFASILETVAIDGSIWASDPASGPFGERLRENVPSDPIEAPLLIGQGLEDALVLPAAQEAYVNARCQAGGSVDYRTYAGFEHVDVVQAGSPLVPELLAWTQERLNGQPATSSC
jgi:pimeloyl-ACP methyl ester carboxylesterase